MSEQKYIKAQVVSSRLLGEDEKSLLSELYAFQADSIKQLRESFRHIITLSTAIIGVQIMFIQLSQYTVSQPFDLIDLSLLFSFTMLFLSVLVAIFGQFSNRFYISNLNTIQMYRQYREKVLMIGYRLYIITSALFIVGLVVFIVNSFVLLIQ
jgi:hypothetical protein